MAARPTLPQMRRPGGALPSIVDAILVFFYIITWINLAGITLGAVGDTRNGQYGYLVPIGLYGLLLLSFVVRNARRYWTTGGNASDWLWGYEDQIGHIALFLGGSLLLIAWASALAPFFAYLYFPLYGHTWGMLAPRRRAAVAFYVVAVGAQAVQSGLLALVARDGFGALIGPDVLGYLIITAVITAYFILLGGLITSRIGSEQLVRELQAAKARLESALATEREVAVLRERDRMAREMHDGLGHALGLVAVKIEAAQRLQAVDPARAAAELEATKDLVRQSGADLRASLANLRSPALEAGQQPLDQALGAWAEKTARESGVALVCRFEPGLDTLSAPIQDTLWRVGREAIFNVVKHARAAHAELHVFRKDGAVYLSVADDGVGIPHLADGNARLEVPGHYGIRGMRERLEAFGGTLTLRPGRGTQGTLLLARVPLPAPEAPPASRLRDRFAPLRGLHAGREEGP